MFALPLDEQLSGSDLIHAATIMASMIGTRGVMSGSYMHTYFFHFRAGAMVEFVPGETFSENLIEKFAGKPFVRQGVTVGHSKFARQPQRSIQYGFCYG